MYQTIQWRSSYVWVISAHTESAKIFKNGVVQVYSDGDSEHFTIESTLNTMTSPETPQQSPSVEGINRTDISPVCTLPEKIVLSANYWPFALEQVVRVKNRLSYWSLNGRSPFKTFSAIKLSLCQVRIFGCAAFVFNHTLKSKIHGKVMPAFYLDGDDNDAYILECIQNRKIV